MRILTWIQNSNPNRSKNIQTRIDPKIYKYLLDLNFSIQKKRNQKKKKTLIDPDPKTDPNKFDPDRFHMIRTDLYPT